MLGHMIYHWISQYIDTYIIILSYIYICTHNFDYVYIYAYWLEVALRCVHFSKPHIVSILTIIFFQTISIIALHSTQICCFLIPRNPCRNVQLFQPATQRPACAGGNGAEADVFVDSKIGSQKGPSKIYRHTRLSVYYLKLYIMNMIGYFSCMMFSYQNVVYLWLAILLLTDLTLPLDGG